MFGRARIVLTIAACAFAMPAAAQAPAPTTTAFDVTYIGVSRTLEGTMDFEGGNFSTAQPDLQANRQNRAIAQACDRRTPRPNA